MSTAVSWVYRAGYCMPGGYLGGLYRVLPSHPAPREEDHPDSEAGPGSPSRGWSGWSGWSGRVSPRGRSGPPCGPGRSTPGGPPCPSLAKAASGPIRARFKVNLLKVSQNGLVSPKYVNKACHSPCFQNELQMSALDFLRFPFLTAFSHKELMGRF